MTPADVIREMRDMYRTIPDSWLKRWADELEAAMRESDAKNERLREAVANKVSGEFDAYRKLLAENERLRTDLETAERALDAQTDFRKEIRRLRAALVEVDRYADDSIGSRYGTLGASFVQKIVRAALAQTPDA